MALSVYFENHCSMGLFKSRDSSVFQGNQKSMLDSFIDLSRIRDGDMTTDIDCI